MWTVLPVSLSACPWQLPRDCLHDDLVDPQLPRRHAGCLMNGIVLEGGLLLSGEAGLLSLAQSIGKSSGMARCDGVVWCARIAARGPQHIHEQRMGSKRPFSRANSSRLDPIDTVKWARIVIAHHKDGRGGESASARAEAEKKTLSV